MALTRGPIYNTDSGTCDETFLPTATTTTKGTVELATDGENLASVVVQGNDSRLSNARIPTAHKATHEDGGSDEITTALDPRAYPLLSDVVANRPSASVNGRMFWSTDEGILYRDNGSTWDKIAVRDLADGNGSIASTQHPIITSGDLHTEYQKESEKDAASGYAGLTASTKIAAAQITEVLALADLSDVTAKTGTGTTAVMQGSPSLTTPTIADFTNSNHSHTGTTSGGTLNASAITAGTVATARLGSGTADATTYLRGDQTWSIPSGGSGGDTTVRLTANRTSTSTAFADCTGLSFDVSASTNYWFDFLIIFQSTATGTGINLGINGPANPTAIVVQKIISTSLVASVVHMSRAYNVGTASGTVDTANANCIASLRGILLNGNNSGTLIVSFASETGTQVSIQAGSMGRLLVI